MCRVAVCVGVIRNSTDIPWVLTSERQLNGAHSSHSPSCPAADGVFSLIAPRRHVGTSVPHKDVDALTSRLYVGSNASKCTAWQHAGVPTASHGFCGRSVPVRHSGLSAPVHQAEYGWTAIQRGCVARCLFLVLWSCSLTRVWLCVQHHVVQHQLSVGELPCFLCANPLLTAIPCPMHRISSELHASSDVFRISSVCSANQSDGSRLVDWTKALLPVNSHRGPLSVHRSSYRVEATIPLCLLQV